MTVILWATWAFAVLSQFAVGWLMSVELFLLKDRPWLAALVQFFLGLIVLAMAHSLVGIFLVPIYLVIIFVWQPDFALTVPNLPQFLILTGVVVMAIRLVLRARERRKVLQWQAKGGN